MDLKQSVAIELDRVRHLRFGTNAIIEFEELSGKPITVMDTDRMGFKDIRIMFYVSLVHEDKDLTFEKVGDLMDIGLQKYGMDGLMQKIEEAFNLALPEQKKA